MAALCSVRDVNRCGQVVASGVFDGALDGKVDLDDNLALHSLDQALDFCQRMIVVGGVCEDVHPVTFIMWRHHATQMCGDPIFPGGVHYDNPKHPTDAMDVLSVSYSKIVQFQMANSFRFRFFVGLILFIWYVNML